MDLRHAAQLPQGVLQPLAQTLVTLREADRPRLPVRVRQHEVVDQVFQPHATDRHPQLGTVREVAGTQPARMMHLGEEHFLRRPVQGPPLLEPPLQRPQLAVGEATGIAALQVGEQRLGLQAGIELQQRLQLGPDFDEGIGSGSPVTVHAFPLTGQLAEATILAGRLGRHAGSQGRSLPGDSLHVEVKQPADLMILDHGEPPVGVPAGVRRLADREF